MQLTVTPENVGLINALIYLAFALPTVPLVLGWRAVILNRPGRITTSALGILTASYLWVVAIIVGVPVIAPHYTAARANLINLNLVAILIASILVLVGRRTRWQLLLAGCGTFVLWWYLAVIGTVV